MDRLYRALDWRRHLQSIDLLLTAVLLLAFGRELVSLPMHLGQIRQLGLPRLFTSRALAPSEIIPPFHFAYTSVMVQLLSYCVNCPPHSFILLQSWERSDGLASSYLHLDSLVSNLYPFPFPVSNPALIVSESSGSLSCVVYTVFNLIINSSSTCANI